MRSPLLVLALSSANPLVAGDCVHGGTYKVQLPDSDERPGYPANFELTDIAILHPKASSEPLVINYTIPEDLTGGVKLNVHLKSRPWSLIKDLRSKSFPMTGPIAVGSCSWNPRDSSEVYFGQPLRDHINSGQSIALARCEWSEGNELRCRIEYPSFDSIVETTDQVRHINEKYGEQSPIAAKLIPLAVHFSHEPIGWINITSAAK